MSIIKIKKRINPYVQIDKGCLDDPFLSWQAKGILCYLLSKPEDWKPKIEDIIKKGKDGKKAVYNTMAELIDAGYVVKESIRDNGRIVGVEYTVYELPVSSRSEDIGCENAPNKQTEPLPQKGKVEMQQTEPLPPFQEVEKVDTEKVDTENGTHNNKESSKKEKNKKERVLPAFDALVKEELDQLEEGFCETWKKYQDWFGKQKFEYVTKIRDQLTPRQLHTLLEKYSSRQITNKIVVIENGQKKYTGNKSVYLTLCNWLEMYPV